jgi:hypothetical protein
MTRRGTWHRPGPNLAHLLATVLGAGGVDRLSLLGTQSYLAGLKDRSPLSGPVSAPNCGQLQCLVSIGCCPDSDPLDLTVEPSLEHGVFGTSLQNRSRFRTGIDSDVSRALAQFKLEFASVDFHARKRRRDMQRRAAKRGS